MKRLCLSILATLLLSACAQHAHRLVAENDTTFINGALIHNRGQDNRLILETPERRYEARGFSIERQTDWAELRKRYYGNDPRHWDRIFSGLDSDHSIFSLQTAARSNDGKNLSCRIAWTARSKPAGVCSDQDGKAFPVNFE